MRTLLFLFSFVFLVSCSKEDDAGDVNTEEFKQIITILPQDQWKVTRFYADNDDHTIDFESFIFTFQEDGVVYGKTDLYTEEGYWAYKSTPENGEQLVLEFSGTVPFDRIMGDWDIISLSNAKVELTQEGATNEETKLLTFSKL